MNRDTAEVLGIVVAIILIFVTLVFLATTPFALLGWIVLSFVNIFGAGLLTSYFNCATTGLFIGIIAGLTVK